MTWRLRVDLPASILTLVFTVERVTSARAVEAAPHGHGCNVNQVFRPCAKDVHSEHPASRFVIHHFDQALGFAANRRRRVVFERRSAHPDGEPLLPSLRLREPHLRDRRDRED